ncbi:MAG: GDP-mannose 4,6-dehydratase [Planctomycetia bacterium]|nr:GDP-mannose 4,6-dehydratase [Planctomycetia bacterium]
MNKTALITGITGQDGAYLSRLLLQKNYRVHGLKRRSSNENQDRAEQLHLIDFVSNSDGASYQTHYGDMTDTAGLVRLIDEIRPDEIYNLAAQSHVRVSFDMPEFTGNVNGLGTLRLLEAIRLLGLEKNTKFYQASTSELYGNVQGKQNEETPFAPRSPYAAAKLFAYWTTVNYREAYGIFACNGILFNHESPLRGENFVTRKITNSVAKIHYGLLDKLTMGNIDACRDWGHAADFVEGMVLMLQQAIPDDYILATGEVHSVREFIEKTFARLDYEIVWQGKGVDEKGIERKSGRTLIEIDPIFFRPTEVRYLCGDSSKAKKFLNWKPRHSFDDLIDDMLRHDLDSVQNSQSSFPSERIKNKFKSN